MPGPTPTPATKICLFCGQPFARRPHAHPRDWAHQRFCGRACVNGRRRADLRPQRCVVCEKTFDKPDGVTTNAWRMRKTCGPECRDRLKYRKFLAPPPADVLRDLYVIRRFSYARIGRAYKCSARTAGRWIREAGIVARQPKEFDGTKPARVCERRRD